MNKLFEELSILLEDFKRDREHVENNQDLLLGYADDFYDMLSRLRDKMDVFLYG